MAKYEPLERYLRAQERALAPLTFSEVETLISCKLPRSAREWPVAWWSNEPKTHSQARAWWNAGWRVWEVRPAEEIVVFRQRSHERGETRDARHDVGTVVSDFPFSPAALKLIQEYAAEAAGDVSAAIARAVHDAAIARRGRLVERNVAQATRMPHGAPDSVELSREDRDGR